MSQVAIEKVDTRRTPTASVFEEMRALSDRVREHAFELFEQRGSGDGMAMQDWLNAERDLFRIPESELIDHDGTFEARLSAPGFDVQDVHVTALPDALIVKGQSSHRHDKSEGDVRFCEFDQKTLFRRFDLPEPINIEKVSADLEKGVLHVTAAKAKQPASEGRQVRAA